MRKEDQSSAPGKVKSKAGSQERGFLTQSWCVMHLCPSTVHRGAAPLKALFRVQIKGPGGLVVISGATGPSTQSGLLVLWF